MKKFLGCGVVFFLAVAILSCHGGGGPVFPPPGTVQFSQLSSFLDHLFLDWEDYTQTDFKGYNLYRATSANGPWTRIATLLTASEYSDFAVQQGIEYFYHIRVVNKQNREGNPSQVISGKLKGEETPPSAPRNLRSSAGDGRVYLEWQPSPEQDVAFYNIYRNTFNSVPPTPQYFLARVAHPQTNYLDLAVTNNTTYYYVVTAVDTSGNESGPSNMTFPTTPFPDTIPPETILLLPLPDLYTQSTSATFSFDSNEAGSTFTCSLDGAGFSPCTSPVNFSNLSEGQHTFRVRATDLSGNTDPTPATHTWNIDHTGPTINLTQFPPSLTNQNFANFAWNFSDASPIVQIQCHLVGQPAFRPCTTSSTDQLTNLTEGAQTWHLMITDAAGNETTIAYNWTTDYTPPETQIVSAPGRYTNQTSLTFTYSSEPSATFECRLTPLETAFSTCPSSGKQYSSVPEGNYAFEVRAKDAAGNLDSSPASTLVTVDTTPPTISNLQGPPPLTNSNQANFSWTNQDNLSPILSALCQLVNVDPDFRNCSSLTSDALTNVPEGPNTWHVTIRDEAGNESVLTEYSWTTDYTAPGATILTKPPRYTNQTQASFTYQSDNGTATFECQLEPLEGNFSSCPATGKTYSGLTEGNYTFRVRARDPAGNVGQPDSYDFTVDTTPPVVQMDSRTPPGDFINQTTVTITFSGSDNLSPFRFQCHLVGRDPSFRDCTSPDVLSGLTEGSWTWHLRGVDEAGNQSPPIEETWTVDLTPPTVSITSTDPAEGSYSSNPQPTFTFSASELSQFSCTIDSNPPVDCSSSFSDSGSYTPPSPLADGPHTFLVVATDRAGNSSDPNDPNARRNWMVDTTPPVYTVLQPNGGENVPNGAPYEIRWDATEATSAISAQSIFISSDSGANWNPLVIGLPGDARLYFWDVPSDLVGTTFRIRVQGIDLANNIGQDDSDADFSVVDLTPPQVTVLVPNGGEEYIATLVPIQWTSSDNVGVESHNIQFSPDNGNTWEDIVTGLPGDAQNYDWDPCSPTPHDSDQALIKVIALDAAGNAGEDQSDGVFRIVCDNTPPVITVIQPNGGERVDAPSTYTIRWTAVDPAPSAGMSHFDIYLSTDEGNTYPTVIAQNLPASTACPNLPDCSYNWTVDPDLFTYKARIRVVGFDNVGLSGQDDSDNNFTIRFYERWESESNPSAFGEQHPTSKTIRWWQFLFGGDANCPGPPANPYRWFFADDQVFGTPQGNHSQNFFRWDVCQNDPNYFYPPGDLLGLVAGPFDFRDANTITLDHNSEWWFDPQDIGRLLISAPLATPTSACNTASTYYLMDHLTGSSPHFGDAFDSVQVDLTNASTPEGNLRGSVRCIGFITWDIDGDGDGGQGFGWFIDDVRITKE
ncbi:MAG: Ig-like domain-containing protein [bacterium JZ-2024 1]